MLLKSLQDFNKQVLHGAYKYQLAPSYKQMLLKKKQDLVSMLLKSLQDFNKQEGFKSSKVPRKEQYAFSFPYPCRILTSKGHVS